jgi:hypothetical protein
MNAKKAKRLRREAERLTPHLKEATYTGLKTVRLHECRRGAYHALKSGNYRNAIIESV